MYPVVSAVTDHPSAAGVELTGFASERRDDDLAGSFELSMLLRVALATAKDLEPERNRGKTDEEQRPDIDPERADSRAVENRVADPAQRIGRGRDLGNPLHPLRQDRDRVVDAGDDEHHALRDEAELRAFLG